MGIKEIISKWIAFRENCVKRKTSFDLNKKKSKLHLLEGLNKIILDIDKAVHIVRNTKEEVEVVPNLMKSFEIDSIQAEYVSEIKLRQLNKEYILKRISEIKSLKEEIKELESILSDITKVDKLIIEELKYIAKHYGKERNSLLISPEESSEEEISIPDYQVNFFLSREGYFKKITPQSLKMNSEQKLKNDDEIIQEILGSNHSDLLFFTNHAQVYKSKAYNFSDTKASSIGDFIPAALGFDKGEKIVYMAVTIDYSGFMIFFFSEGKVAKVEMKSYFTKTNRKKLIKAYCEESSLVNCNYLKENKDYLLKSSSGKILIINTEFVSLKQSKNTQGISVLKQKKGHKLISAEEYKIGKLKNENIYRAKNVPSGGKIYSDSLDSCEQLKLV